MSLIGTQGQDRTWRDNYEMRVGDWNLAGDQDFSPPDFRVMPEKVGWRARLRPLAHPLIIGLHEPFVRRRVGDLGLGAPCQVVWGNRGGGTQFLTRRIGRYLQPRGADVLLQGVGFGPELQYWTKLRPGYIAGTEILNYTRAWEVVKRHYDAVRIEFFRTTGSDLSAFGDASFDIVSSTAVLEHVQEIPALLAETARVLRPRGIAAFCFGPLFYTFGGDHFCGERAFEEGFNHVLLEDAEYAAFLDSIPYREGGLADGRVWIRQRLFSYLRPAEYVGAFKALFDILFLRVHVNPKAWRYRQRYPERYARLVARHGLRWTDPLVAGMEIFLRKKAA